MQQNVRLRKVDPADVKPDTSICSETNRSGFPSYFALFGNAFKEFFKHGTKDYGT